MATVPDWVDELVEEEAEADGRGTGIPEPADSGDEPTSIEPEPGTGADESEALPAEDAPGEPTGESSDGEPGAEDTTPEKQDLPGGLRYEIAKLRESRRELEAKLKEKDERIARYDTLESRLSELQAKLAAPKTEEEKAPDFAFDPTANLDHRTKQVETEIETLRREREERAATQSEYTERNKRIQEGIGKVRAHEQMFREHFADYDAALDHARARLANQIRTQNQIWGRVVTDEQIQNHIATLELQTAFQALDNGLNPAEVAYKLARQQYGYTGQAPEVGNGVDEETQRLEDGLKASRGGKSGVGKKTKDIPESTDNLPELEAALEELTRHFH